MAFHFPPLIHDPLQQTGAITYSANIFQIQIAMRMSQGELLFYQQSKDRKSIWRTFSPAWAQETGITYGLRCHLGGPITEAWVGQIPHKTGIIEACGMVQDSGEHGIFSLQVVGTDRQALVEVIEQYLRHHPAPKMDPKTTIPMGFWALNTRGAGRFYSRMITAPHIPEIVANYTPETATTLSAYGDWKKPEGFGQLMLWHGPPGTGKTTAIRALSQGWRRWCSFAYVTDPDALLGSSAYLTQVLMNNSEEDEDYLAEIFDPEDEGKKIPPNKWRCLILEDTGELLGAEAKGTAGQGLSRLLNIVDGLLGQGLKLLVLITSNEDIRKFHPAIVRHGRCLSLLEFQLLPGEQAREWLTAHGQPPNGDPGPLPLASLYSKLTGDRDVAAPATGVGFHR